MTVIPNISVSLCQDLIYRMEQARQQNNETIFNLEKNRLLDALEIIKTDDPKTYVKYSYASEMMFLPT